MIARLAIFVTLAVIILLALLFSRAQAGTYPSVRELEQGLGFISGSQIPKDVPVRNRGWHVFYEGARSIGGGLYNVRIRLR